VVLSRPRMAREQEYNEWYDEVHLADVCSVPGFVGARRYGRSSAPVSHADMAPYLAIYEIDADDPASCIDELMARVGDGRIKLSEALQLDPAPLTGWYELR